LGDPFSEHNYKTCYILRFRIKYTLSMKVWQHPPAWSCCSSTRTFFPALAMIEAVERPPMPLPMTMASRSFGTLSMWKDCLMMASLFFWSVMYSFRGLRSSLNQSIEAFKTLLTWWKSTAFYRTKVINQKFHLLEDIKW